MSTEWHCMKVVAFLNFGLYLHGLYLVCLPRPFFLSCFRVSHPSKCHNHLGCLFCEVRLASMHRELWLWHFVLDFQGIKPLPLLTCISSIDTLFDNFAQKVIKWELRIVICVWLVVMKWTTLSFSPFLFKRWRLWSWFWTVVEPGFKPLSVELYYIIQPIFL